MSRERVIEVRVVDGHGYGRYGYRVKCYGGNEVRTDTDGRAVLSTSSSSVTIYVNGSTEYDGSTSNCPNPLIAVRR